ncbi:MAG: N-acetylmuramoyl-L-alanine amidase, partial [Bacteroides acidifaciens]|nr:N-acetylmuramoyl-L-alanine amidase [Bacteroides acidifaciens]
RSTLRQLVGQLQERFPGCRVCGHRDLSPDLNGNGEIEPEEWIKQCPCFDVAKEFKDSGESTAQAENTEGHRVTQHTKEQKGGKLWQ